MTYRYTATGSIEHMDYKGPRDVEYAYTIRDWVKAINEVGSPGGNFAAFYDYTDNGNVEKAQFYNPQNQISGHDHYHQSFTYDGLNRLKSADYGPGSDSSSDLFDVTGLDYDAAGNIETLQRNDDTGNMIDNLTYHYSAGNRLQSLDDAAGRHHDWDVERINTFGYDANGNLISQTGKFSDIAYDHRNLPVHFYMDGGDEVVAGYNADGRRILKELKDGAWQFYVMDGDQTLAVIDNSGFSHFNLVGNSTFGRWEPGGARRYYLKDHLGSTRAVVDSNGTVLETFDYYPFGLLMPGRTTAGANTLEKFTGKERDTEANLNLDYFGGRFYDPALARWTTVDPLANKVKPKKFPYHSTSPYVYSLNNPVLYKDENGLWVITAQLSGRSLAFVISGGASVGLALDDKGNVGLMVNGSLGGGLGVGAAGGLEFSFFPAAKTIDEISGLGATVGGFIGVPGEFLSAEANASFLQDGNENINDFRLGASASGIPGTGVGAGIGAFAELSYTHVSKSLRFNLLDLFKGDKELSKDNKAVRQLKGQLGISVDETIELLNTFRTLFDKIQAQQEEEKEEEK